MKRSKSDSKERQSPTFPERLLVPIRKLVNWLGWSVSCLLTGVVELPTGSIRVGLSGLTRQSSGNWYGPQLQLVWARTVVVLAGRRRPQKRATWRSVSQVLVRKYSVEGFASRRFPFRRWKGCIVTRWETELDIRTSRASPDSPDAISSVKRGVSALGCSDCVERRRDWETTREGAKMERDAARQQFMVM